MKSRAEAAFFNAFIELLKIKSFNEITASEIIRHSGYSRSGFYKLFYDKYALADQLVSSLAAAYAETLSRNMIELRDTQDFTYHYAVRMLRFAKERKEIFKLIFSGALPGGGQEEFCQKAIKAFHEVGNFDLITDNQQISEEFFDYISTHHFFDYIKYWNSTDYQESEEELARQILFLQNHMAPMELLRSGKKAQKSIY